MPWFDRLRGELDPDEAARRLQQVVDRAKISAALVAASGPHGLRRYLVRVELKGGRPRIVGVDTAPLPKGGGPPAPAAFDAGAALVEAALQTMRVHMPAPFSWSRAAIGVLRDGEGNVALMFRFDEDVDAFRLDDLPVPTGPPAPLEDPAYLKALSVWDGRVAAVRARWLRPGPDESWSLEEGALKLDGPAGTRVIAAEPLATWVDGAFAWVVAEPVGDERPFVEPELALDLAGAMELAVFAAARMGRPAVFSGDLEGGGTLFAALRE
jgi:hypothetical protein